MPKKGIVILLSGLVIVSIIMGIVVWWVQPKEDRIESQIGNTFGNIKNLGMAVQRGDWIYYCNKSNNYSLNKTRTNGIESIKLVDGVVSYINIIGNWIYYEGRSSKIYKMKTDGSSLEVVVPYHCNEFIILDEWIYHHDENYRLLKIRTDGTDLNVICKEKSRFIGIDNDWIFYINEDDENCIYKIKTDGTGREIIYPVGVEEAVLENGFIYISNSSYFEFPRGIRRIKLDGSGEEFITTEENVFINIDKEWIYYCNVEDNNNLYKIKIDGTEKEHIVSDKCYAISVTEDWIYYYSQQGEHIAMHKDKIYRVRKDGSERQIVS